jgi:hypothetical protein
MVGGSNPSTQIDVHRFMAFFHVISGGINMNRASLGNAGGLLSFLAFVAAAVFFGCAVFGFSLSDVPLVDAGLFSLALAFVLGRVGY